MPEPWHDMPRRIIMDDIVDPRISPGPIRPEDHQWWRSQHHVDLATAPPADVQRALREAYEREKRRRFDAEMSKRAERFYPDPFLRKPPPPLPIPENNSVITTIQIKGVTVAVPLNSTTNAMNRVRNWQRESHKLGCVPTICIMHDKDMARALLQEIAFGMRDHNATDECMAVVNYGTYDDVAKLISGCTLLGMALMLMPEIGEVVDAQYPEVDEDMPF